MTGEELYDQYVVLYLLMNNRSVDQWGDLGEAEQGVWNTMVDQLMEEIRRDR